VRTVSSATVGRASEHAARRDLTRHGYRVMRAAGSKGPLGDLIAVRPGQIVFVNVKRTTMPGPDERKQLLAAAHMAHPLGVAVVALGTPTHIQWRRLVTFAAGDWLPWEPEGEPA
jgi:Holliday junction resolvase